MTIFQLLVNKTNDVKEAIDAEVLKNVFLSNVIKNPKFDDNKTEQKDLIVSSREYIDILQPILLSVNPSCRFTVACGDCFVRCNKQKENRKINVFSAKLRCAFEDCPMRVTVHVTNPEGNVTLFFSKSTYADRSEESNEGNQS